MLCVRRRTRLLHRLLVSPLILLLLGIFGLVYGSSQLAREKILEQLSYVVDRHGLKVIEDIANNAAQPTPGILAAASALSSRSLAPAAFSVNCKMR